MIIKIPPITVGKCKSGELQINCDGKSTARLCRFACRRTISGITKILPFEDLDFYDLFRITFENSELGRMKRLLPLHEMAVNFGLVSNRYERRRGPKPFFSAEGKHRNNSDNQEMESSAENSLSTVGQCREKPQNTSYSRQKMQ